MQLEEQAAGIAENLAGLIAAPERSGGCLTVHAGWLLSVLVIVSRGHGRHDCRGERCSLRGALHKKVEE